jgi:hypothetical protein
LAKGADPNLRGELESIAQSAAEKYSTLQGGPISVQSAEAIGQKAAAQALKTAGQSAVDIDSVASAATNIISNIGDQNAKAAWAIVQRQIDSGQLTDHKALSSALNKALNQTFSDYGVNPYSPAAESSKQIAKDVFMKAKDTESLLTALQSAKKESTMATGVKLSEGQVYLVFNRICATNNHLLAEGILQEGPLDSLKGLATKGLEKVKTAGKNLTTKVTADKLNSAWQKAGAPMDSQVLAAFLGSQGVSPDVVSTVYQSMKIEKPKNTADQTAKTSSQYADVKAMIAKLDKKGRQRMAAYIQKQLGTV